MNNRLTKRLIARGKPKDFAAASDTRTKRPPPSLTSATRDSTHGIFALLYRNAQALFFFGLLLAGGQFAVQMFYWANERVWKPYSALTLLKRFHLEPAHSGAAQLLDLMSAGVALAALSFAVMLLAQFFMKASSA